MRTYVLTLAVLAAAASPALAQIAAPATDAAEPATAPAADPTTAPPAASDLTGMTIITPKGYVSLMVRNDWTIIGAQSQMPVAVVGFAIPDPASDGTDAQSTNLAVDMCDPSDPKGQEAMKIYGASVGGEVTSETYKTWTVYTQTAKDGDTDYTIMDGVSHIADVDVGVRIAWPHLAGHASDYDADMRTTFLDQLDHVTGGLGEFTMPKDATAWRPNGQ